jgi:hypothetical protein
MEKTKNRDERRMFGKQKIIPEEMKALRLQIVLGILEAEPSLKEILKAYL